AQVKQKEAALRQAEVDLEHTTIRAPVDGVVVSRQVDVGQTVAASLQAPTLFTIAQDLTRMQVDTSVDEADIGRVRLDGPAVFTVDAFPGETFRGRVVQIRKAAQVVQNVVTYTVVVAVDNPQQRLLPGMTANVKLVVADKAEVLKVPNAALRFRPAGADPAEPNRVPGSRGRPGPERRGPRDGASADRRSTPEEQTAGRVWVLGPDGRPRAVPVTLGITDGSATEVVAGELREGQEVIVGTMSAPAPTRPGGGPRLRL
ncbi:MAG TPA: efflux RND transporter periplasmic adaptor subunit, partial [Candidatus Binatia bacterium]|nr:efflux RND transporter periplasmic adaptor subunit [Candidatus Binatia bacterium]